MSEIKLKSCPFCGSPGEIDYIAVCENPYFPQCSNEQCIASDTGISFETEEEAAETWNRRAGEQKGQANRMKTILCGRAGKDGNGMCMGFSRSEIDDEPCETCKKCKLYTGNEDEQNEGYHMD